MAATHQLVTSTYSLSASINKYNVTSLFQTLTEMRAELKKPIFTNTFFEDESFILNTSERKYHQVIFINQNWLDVPILIKP